MHGRDGHATRDHRRRRRNIETAAIPTTLSVPGSGTALPAGAATEDGVAHRLPAMIELIQLDDWGMQLLWPLDPQEKGLYTFVMSYQAMMERRAGVRALHQPRGF